MTDLIALVEKVESGALTLPLKAEYFDAIRDGTKLEEYRLVTPFWRKRFEGHTYRKIVLTKGYPERANQARRIERAWNGYRIIDLQHDHFGGGVVTVFAIDVSQPLRALQSKEAPNV